MRRGLVAQWTNDGLAYGGDYNPEQWSAEVRAQDVTLMGEAGVTLVTVGVFSWGLYEPRAGQYEFDWLDETLDRLHRAGIGVDLATPTAAPPMWLLHDHPEILRVDRAATRSTPGGRLGWCPSHPVWREHALRIVTVLAERYGTHPALRLWHISNELGGGNRHCYCEVSAEHFRRWLAARYGTVDALNAAWGTAFWGHRYPDFDHVLPPRAPAAAESRNPSLVLDFDRFSSDALLEHLRAERAVLRRVTPQVPVTTNFMVGAGPHVVDHARWAPDLDVLSNDHYVRGADQHQAQDVAFAADRVRGLSPDAPWLLMETAPSAVSWQGRNLPLDPGQLRRIAFTHVGRGADGVLMFQWRASVAGAEQFHSGMVPHAGRRSRTWREVVALGADLAAAGPLAGTLVERARIAILVDDESDWAWAAGPKPIADDAPTGLPRRVHRALWARGRRVDLVPTARLDELAQYDLVIVAGLYLADGQTATALARVAERGGAVLVTYLSGIVGPDNQVVPGGYPGVLKTLLGVHVEEFVPVLAGEIVELDRGWAAHDWTESLSVDDARVVARYATGRLSGQPAVTRRTVGAGQAWYVSASLDDAALGELLDEVTAGLDIAPTAVVDAGIDVVRRTGEGASYLVAVNHGDRPGAVEATGVDLLTGTRWASRCPVPAGGVVVIDELG
ncbi:beta-galactosidase [Pengzhenrongella frigida]|uniref:Beta-galactosidase n=1 Tax=Pengzhenrongella frigida TaxID=1259133 RepID=A0A4Q5N1M4_9MICO|nr:beta-galactosidase [Cellulomonas sp. HLT2-17]RYV51946.1 beta-galactosidase [Cellulomonas sp. HLT2-17]